ncbi:MAG: hypothetical protein JOZ24_03100, partial [Candidatus Eremiobacteraeota bacterium]|nr:hypothetical protein [Candidatus Eremiobacteraeota bacterium]
MITRVLPVIGVLFCAAMPLAAGASTSASASFAAVRVDAAPPLDASLTAPVWSQTFVAKGMQQVSTQQVSPFVSEFRVLYDNANLYVGIRLEQPGVVLTASQTANNVGFGLDDFAGIGIDTSANASQVYFFMTTPRATRYQIASESARYAPPWTALTKQTPEGWNALLVIPLSALRTSGTSVQTWRFDFIRRIAALNVNESWAYDPLMNDAGGSTTNWPAFADARYWPQLTGLQFGGLARHKPRAEFYVLGAAGGDRSRFQAADGSFVVTGTRPAGADFVVPLTPTAAFVAAIAPDFSNVEVDQQTIAPQEFRRALNEYRPFFTQGAAFFVPAFQNGVNAPPNVLFYSPAIGPFDRGLKLEGTQGLQSFGALEARGAGFDDMVFAVRHSVPSHSFAWSIAGVTTHHALGNATADPRAGNDATWEAEISGRNNNTGFVYGLEYARESGTFVPDVRHAARTEDFIDVHRGNYEVFTSYRDIGPLYSPVLGFTQNSDVRGPQGFIDLQGKLAPHGPFKR